jgi:hypothetical protein
MPVHEAEPQLHVLVGGIFVHQGFEVGNRTLIIVLLEVALGQTLGDLGATAFGEGFFEHLVGLGHLLVGHVEIREGERGFGEAGALLEGGNVGFDRFVALVALLVNLGEVVEGHALIDVALGAVFHLHELLELGDALFGLAHFGERYAEVKERVAALGVDFQGALVGGDGGVVLLGGHLNAGEEEVAVEVLAIELDGLFTELAGFREVAHFHELGGEARTHEGAFRIVHEGGAVGFDRALRIVVEGIRLAEGEMEYGGVFGSERHVDHGAFAVAHGIVVGVGGARFGLLVLFVVRAGGFLHRGVGRGEKLSALVSRGAAGEERQKDCDA